MSETVGGDGEGVWIGARVIRQRCLETSNAAQTIDESNDHAEDGFLSNTLKIQIQL